MLEPKIKARIETDLRDNDVMLYMKGSKTEPLCGFSAQVVHLLNSYKVSYQTADVLADWDLREGLKAFSNWPTIPQLYVRGKFIGGCDIVMELHRKGELQKVLG